MAMPATREMSSARIQFILIPPGSDKTTKIDIATPDVTPADRSISPSRMTNTTAMESMAMGAA